MKSNKNEEFKLNLIGALIILFGIAAILNSIISRNYGELFWFCYIGLILTGFGVLTRNNFLIMSQIYILVIPIIIWDIDFVHWVILQKPLWGLTDYFFVEISFNIGRIISLQHLFTMPLAIYAANLVGIKKNSAWKLSIIQIALVYAATIIFTQSEQNINCVFSPCVITNIGIPYAAEWFAVFFAIIFITREVMSRIFPEKKSHNLAAQFRIAFRCNKNNLRMIAVY